MAHEGKILIVEDLKEWEEVIKEILLEIENYTILSAQTLRQARGLFKDHVFDLVILDLRLKDWDDTNFEGWELLSDLEVLTPENGTQVIIVSAHGTLEHVRDAFKDYDITVTDFYRKQTIGEDKPEFQKSVKEAIDTAFNIRDEILRHK